MGDLAAARGGGEAHIERVITQVHAELEDLLKKRAEIVKRIGTIRQTIVGLANVFGEGALGPELLELIDRRPQERQTGFTKACRIVLMEAQRPLTAREVCRLIGQRNPALLARHKDPLASVTTVLNRLANYGEARFVLNQQERRTWQWVSDRDANPVQLPNSV
ncbi:MAG TPA: hypothetical protein VLW84_10925 [Terriglobales bacterium]|nr:hypothetical protein [Terriglobales bacterium]